jgi:endonuclease YncB( thermonuclease family)
VRNRAAIAVGIVAALAAGGCRRTPGGDGPGADAGRDTGAGELDAGGVADAGMLRDGGCPAPETISTDEIPARYLPAMPAELLETVDGDTARVYTRGVSTTLRFLHVNTEESGGPEMTPFGRYSSSVVAGWLRAAVRIDVAPQDDPRSPGNPDLDPYDRWLSLIFLDGELLQTRIIREGLSAYYTEFGCAGEPVHRALVRAEAEARANQRGIWAADHPRDYGPVLDMWIDDACRPNPFIGQPYCE